MDNEQLKRIADALEEVLRLVKKDQEEAKKRWEKDDEQIIPNLDRRIRRQLQEGQKLWQQGPRCPGYQSR
jgi:hypothetical protein